MSRHIVTKWYISSRNRNRKKREKNNILSITYDVWINGIKLDIGKKACINSIEIKETDEGADVATIQIQDPNFIFIEDNIFIEENPIKIKLGWDNSTYRVNFDGFISALDINFESSGLPKITITCMDNTHKMNRAKKDNTFKNTTSAEVVKQIGQQYGYAVEVEKEYKFEVQETITQSKQSDIEFIMKLAKDETHPFSVRLEGNKLLYVKKGKLTTPKMSLVYRGYPHEIVSFSPKINKETKQEEIKDSSLDTSTKKTSNTKGTVENTVSGNTNSTNSTSNTENGNKGGSKKSGKSYTYNTRSREWKKNG